MGYDKAQDKRLFERPKASYLRITARAFEPEIVAHEHAPIFIVGMPRSGTTLVEQIISSHRLVAGAGELPFIFQFGSSLAVGQAGVDGEALTTFKDQYINALNQRSEGKAIVTDKRVKRNPAAVCWANST